MHGGRKLTSMNWSHLQWQSSRRGALEHGPSSISGSATSWTREEQFLEAQQTSPKVQCLPVLDRQAMELPDKASRAHEA